ncbi:MAG: type II toxin-antitoxin system VapC family toxin [Bacillota bacterium]
MILIDTNVLVYSLQEDAPQHGASRRLIEAAQAGNPLACVFHQNLLEFFAVITDPRRLENPATTAEALDLLEQFGTMLPVLQPSSDSLSRLTSLAPGLEVRGQQIFDCHLVAQMIEAGLETICTYNTKDFIRYPVTAKTPEEILKGLIGDTPPIVQDKERN